MKRFLFTTIASLCLIGGHAQNITFADANVKSICVAKWDTNGDGELSEAEAAAVTDLSSVFSWNTSITSFDELQYFTGLTSIGNWAFAGCSSLASITIPNSVTSIASDAFDGCSSLTSINIPNSVTSIGNRSFKDCIGLTSITIPGSVTSIDNFAFANCSALSSINLPNSITNLGESVFDYCFALTSVTLPENITVIKRGTFYHCTGLTSVTIPELVTEIHIDAFNGCTNLSTITIPNSVTSIGETAFQGCRSLTSITIPNSVTNIGEYAFSGCYNLTSVVSQTETPFNNDNFAFTSISSKCTLTVPAGTRDAYIAAGWTEDVFKGGIVENISFADANVKALCVANWDTNGDGELSEAEAAAVTDLGEVFKGITTIQTFDELQYFTGLTSIGERAFDRCSGLTSVTIPNSVTSIGNYAFANCSGLPSVTIPNSVTSIGNSAFLFCNGLTSIKVESGNTSYDSRDNCNAIIQTVTNTLITGCKNTVIPSGVTSIGERAFEDCSGLTSVTIPNSVTSIGNSAFTWCSGLTSVTIPNSVTSIGISAFAWCSGLTSVTIPSSVTSIGVCAFQGCSGLTSVVAEMEIPFAFGSDAFINIGSSCVLTVPYGTRDAYIAAGWTEDVFKGGIVENISFADANVKALCVANWDTNGDGELSEAEAAAVTDLGEVFKGITTIQTFDELQYFTGLTSIGEYAFAGCSGLTSVTIPSSVTSIGNFAFSRCSGLTSVTIGSSVTSIGSYAFYECSGLTSVTIGSSVTSIGEQAFDGCSGLTSVTIPNSVTSIGQGAFLWCSGLTSVKVASGNPVYDSRDNCNAIIETATNTLISGCKSTVIPNSVTSIGNSAFLGCSGLTSVTIPNSVTSIGSAAFYSCSSLTSLTIPSSVTSIEDLAFSGCSGLTSMKVASGNPVYDSRDNCNAIIETASNMLISGCKSTIIPNSVTSIGYSAFDGCSGLTSVTIPSSVTSIGDHAFYNCAGLASIIIPNSVTSIGGFAFSGCSGLTSVTIGSSVTSIGDGAFSSCSGLTSVTIPSSVTSIGYSAFNGCSGLTSVTIPNSVTSIGSCAFQRCSSLTSVTIPSSVTSIGNSAFWNCRGLTSVVAEMETPFAFGSDAFYSIGTSCTLTVPYGTRDAYIAAGWTEDVFKGGIIEAPVPNIDFADANVKALCVAKWDTNGDGELSETEAAAVTDLGEVFKGKTIHTFDELQYFTGLTSIGNQAFNGCSNLTSVTFPSSVTSIGESAFYDCSSLASIAIPASVESIGIYAFSGNCSSLTSIEVADGNSVYDSRENCNAIIATATNTLVAGCENTIIPASVTSIGKGAFELRTGLTSIELPEGLTNIGDYAFKGSGLTSIVISENVTSIGIETFANCNNLTSLLIPNGASVYTSSFSGCNNLKSINHWTNTSNDLYQFNTWSRENDGSGLTVPFIEVWRGAGKMLNNTTITHEPLTGLTPGNYTVTILARAYNEGNSTTYPSGFTFYANDASVALEDVGTTAVYSSEFNGLSTLVYAELSIDCEVQADGILNVGFQIENAVGDWFAFKNLEFSYNYNVEATSIVLNQETLVFTAEGQTTPLTATVAPADATDKSVTWSSSDETVATVSSDGIVTAVGEGAATITATTNDGTNLTATCTVTVNIPADEPDTDISQIDNVVYMEHTEAIVGTEQTLSVRMKNTDAIQTVQFDLYLPDGVEVVLDDDGYELIELSLERTTARKMDQFSVVRTSNGAYRVLINSTRGNTFDGTDGEIATVRVRLADDMSVGDHPVVFRDIVLVNTSSVGYRTEYVKCTLSVDDYIPGDVNNDKAVDAIDLNAITNYILERRTFPFTFNVKAGDVNGDSVIDAIDLNAVTNMILHDSQAGAKPRAVVVGRIDNE